MTSIKKTLEHIQSGAFLSENDMKECITAIMDGQWDDAQISAFLMGLSMRGETIDEITGAAKAMREKAAFVKAPEGAVDCCGTGGDKSGTYNISTAVALLSAACGVPIAKHGNRSASSKSGAADVLEALGVHLDVPQDKLEEALKTYGFAFLMAPHHHRSMKHVVPVRKSIGVRTIFNILGPLANPAGTQYQLLGVYSKDLLMPMAQVLKKLGTKSAWVVHGSDGLDEITTTGETYCACLKDDEITQRTLTPQDFDLNTSFAADLIGGSPLENAAALRAVFDGAKNAYRDIVVANTAAVLVISGRENDLKTAVQKAQQALDNGKAAKLLNDYAAFTQTHAKDI